MSGVYVHIFPAQIYMELCLKWLYLFNSAFALIISQNDITSNTICYMYIFKWVMTWPNHTKRALSQPLIVKLNLLIVF